VRERGDVTFAARTSAPPASSELALGGLLISSERISTETSTAGSTAVRRDAVSKVWVYNDIDSEHALREFVWGLGLASIGTWQAMTRDGVGERIGAAAFGALGAWLLLRLLRRRTELTCFGNKGGQITFAMNRKLQKAELRAFRARMRDEFGWPIQD
jgi:hypothetical protein